MAFTLLSTMLALVTRYIEGGISLVGAALRFIVPDSVLQKGFAEFWRTRMGGFKILSLWGGCMVVSGLFLVFILLTWGNGRG